MSKPISASVAVQITYVLLRILVVVNWLGGAAILALLVVLPNEQWIMTAFKLSPSPEAARLVMGLRAIAKTGSTPANPLHIDAGFSINGWLAVLLTFVLASVFAEGARMREDLAGTV